MALGGALDIEKMREEVRRMFPEYEMSDNVLGSRVTALGLYKPKDATVVFAPPERVERVYFPEILKDRVDVEVETLSRMVTGFNILLGKEAKNVFMPISEARKDLSSIGLAMLNESPRRFADKYHDLMIDIARKRLLEGLLGTPEDLDEYQGESWMTPQQIAVLRELQAECE